MRNHFVADGQRRHSAVIRAAVKAAFANELSQASFWERFRLRIRIHLEIQRRHNEAVSAKSLY